MTTADALLWDPPGPGSWALDRSHFANPITPMIEAVTVDAVESAYRRVFAELGVPAETMAMRFVHGFAYTQVKPLLGGSSSRQPPDVVVRAAFRLHPELRRRERLAKANLDAPPWLAVLERWPNREQELIKLNLSMQQVDLDTLDNDQLTDELRRVHNHVRERNEEHHVLHASDIGPLGLFVAACADWGINAAEALAALIGASPETSEPQRMLRAIRDEVDAKGTIPQNLDQVSSTSARAAQLLRAYLHVYGWIIYSGYDLDDRALLEDPALILKSIMNARVTDTDTDAPIVRANRLRPRVPTEHRAEFDEKLAGARQAMHMRDAQGPLTIEWPLGLLRRVVLELGRRAKAVNRIERPTDVTELSLDECCDLLTSAVPTSQTIASRRDTRHALRLADPPSYLGGEPQEPPLHLLPIGMRTLAQVTQASIDALGMGAIAADTRNAASELDGGSQLSGVGINTDQKPWVGPAVVAVDASDALNRLEPGMALVTHATSPAFNVVIGIAGALVTASGGPMSHAAVLAREIGLPAVVGVFGATDQITDGDTIEVDPTTGTVRRLTE